MTVYLSEDRKSELRRAFVGRLTAHYQNINDTQPEGFSDRVYNVLMGEYLPSLSLVPEMFLTHISEFRLEHKVPLAQLGPTGDTVMRNDSILIKFSTPRVWVSNVDSKGSSYGGEMFGGRLKRRGYYSNDYTMGKLDQWGDVGPEVIAYMTKRAENDVIVENLRGNFQRLLDQNRTLRQLIKAFPPIRSFVPQHYLTQMQGEPKARVGNSKGVDIQFLTTMAVQARMLTA